MSNKYANNHLISTHQGMIIPWGGGESAGSSTRGESFYHRINFNAVSFTHNTRAGFATGKDKKGKTPFIVQTLKQRETIILMIPTREIDRKTTQTVEWVRKMRRRVEGEIKDVTGNSGLPLSHQTVKKGKPEGYKTHPFWGMGLVRNTPTVVYEVMWKGDLLNISQIKDKVYPVGGIWLKGVSLTHIHRMCGKITLILERMEKTIREFERVGAGKNPNRLRWWWGEEKAIGKVKTTKLPQRLWGGRVKPIVTLNYLPILNKDEGVWDGGKRLFSTRPYKSLRGDMGGNHHAVNPSGVSGMSGVSGVSGKQLSGGLDKTKLNEKLSNLVFTGIKDILNNNPINEETQIKLERFARLGFAEVLKDKQTPHIAGVDSNLINEKFNEYIFKISEDLKIILKKRKAVLREREFKPENKKLSNKALFEVITKDIFYEIGVEPFIMTIIYTLLFTATHHNLFVETEVEKTNHKASLSHISLMTGKIIFDHFIKSLLGKSTRDPKETFSKFKDEIIEGYLGKERDLTRDEIYLYIGGYLIEVMRLVNMVEIKVYHSGKETTLIVNLSDEVKKFIPQSLNRAITIPFNLPMIVKPKSCGHNVSGGYLLNDVEFSEPLFNQKIFYGIPSQVQKENKVYFSLNNMMSTPFKINKNLLDYLINFNHIHKLLIDPEEKHEFAEIEKRNRFQEKSYQRFLSQKLLQEYILKIAQTFRDLPEIYFPLRLDQRGRLYPRAVYFHYQSSELAKALLLFANPDYIDRNDQKSLNYLKAYGANLYGNGLNKKAFHKRVEWVNQNFAQIINFENNFLLDKAEDKFLFLSFCLEMRSYNNFLNNEDIPRFKTYLPIQLDGTCNGFQHLAMLSNETKLFETLNLSKATHDEDPKDFYQTVVDLVILNLELKINEVTENEAKLSLKESYQRLLDVGINRKIVKPAIMNKPYNASGRTLVKYIKELLTFHHLEESNEKTHNGELIAKGWYYIPSKQNNFNRDGAHLINHKDIENLVEVIFEIIYVKYPKIKLLTLYLKNIVVILNKLALPIIWKLPHGLKVSQNYLTQKRKKIEPFTYLKNSITLTTTLKNSQDKGKQILAFMPNLVHSLDSSALTLLYYTFYNTLVNENKFVNFYSVHDCYGVTAKHAELLINILRSIYIEIYSNRVYLERFDREIIEFIKNSYGDSSHYDEKTRVLTIEGKSYRLPPIDPLITNPDKESFNRLKDAKYLIN